MNGRHAGQKVAGCDCARGSAPIAFAGLWENSRSTRRMGSPFRDRHDRAELAMRGATRLSKSLKRHQQAIPNRFSGLPIINDEADMRVGFNIPLYAAYGSSLCSLAVRRLPNCAICAMPRNSRRNRRSNIAWACGMANLIAC